MSNSSELLKAAIFAFKSENDPKRALGIAQQILEHYPNTDEAEKARVIVDKLAPQSGTGLSNSNEPHQDNEKKIGTATIGEQGVTLITTGSVNADHKIIDAIFALDSHSGGFFSGVDPAKAFDGVKEQLRRQCESLGGNAVINCQFEYRNALADGFVGKKQAIEIFGYGTAVKA